MSALKNAKTPENYVNLKNTCIKTDVFNKKKIVKTWYHINAANFLCFPS